MSYSDLLGEGRIKPGRFSKNQVRECLRIASRDLEAAASLLVISPEWAFNIAYNAMHQAGRAFMFREGYRPVGEGHHLTVVWFLEAGLGSGHETNLELMDRMRRKRNRATYDRAGTISKREAREALSVAKEFVRRIRDRTRLHQD